MERKSQSVAKYGLLIALGLLFSYIERLIPIPIPVPGVKLGLANLITVVGLYYIGTKGTIMVSLVRIIIVGFTFGNLFSMVYAMSGWFFSLTAMMLVRRYTSLSCIGVSVVGGVSHNIGQIGIAIAITQTPQIIAYLPVLMISGIIAGSIIGVLGGQMIIRIKVANV